MQGNLPARSDNGHSTPRVEVLTFCLHIGEKEQRSGILSGTYVPGIENRYAMFVSCRVNSAHNDLRNEAILEETLSLLRETYQMLMHRCGEITR
jgi:hypothetical protein